MNPLEYGNWHPVLVYRFDGQSPGTMMFAMGMFETGGGTFYNGSYTYVGDGVYEATLLESVGEGPQSGPENEVKIRFFVEWPEQENKVVVTLESVVGDMPPEMLQLVQKPLCFVNGDAMASA